MIRPARTSDARGIATAHVRSWQAVYRGHFPQQYLDGLSVSGRARRWATIISEQHQDVAVCEVRSGIAGFVSIGPSRDDDVTAGTGELTSLYIDPAFWRRGFGSLLVEWARESAKTHRWNDMTLWVLRDNRGARSFYEAVGWMPDGAARTGVLHGTRFVEVRYCRNGGA
jgi:GNAT superfamily N-acetyltransferase